MLEFFIQPFNLQPPPFPPPARGGGLLKPPSRNPPFSSPPSPNYDGACPPLRESHAAHFAKSSAVRTGVSGQAVSVRALRPCRCGVWHGPPGPPTLIVREQATKHRPTSDYWLFGGGVGKLYNWCRDGGTLHPTTLRHGVTAPGVRTAKN